jgi:predicted O-methyltransferase YrrM
MKTLEELQGITDVKIRSLLNKLHDAASKQEEELKQGMASFAQQGQQGKPVPLDQIKRFMDDKYLALDPAQGVFCYLLAKAINARRIIEFGTSFGVSTIYLAMAVRDNGGGLVIGTEMAEQKAIRAQENIDVAGLSKFVDVRIGDALETLKDIQGPIDFFLNDGFPRYALAVLKMVAPHMRSGSVIITDNVGLLKADYREYLEYLRNSNNGFQSVLMGLNEGTEFSVKL